MVAEVMIELKIYNCFNTIDMHRCKKYIRYESCKHDKSQGKYH